MSNRDAALALAPFHLIPLQPGRKAPACPHGFRNATTCAGQIERWWSDEPDAGIGWAPEPSGCCVVDIDCAAGEATWAALQAVHGPAPETVAIATPRGGRHLIFAGSLPSTVGTLGEHVDTRGVGGFGILPPTVLVPHEKGTTRYPGGAYTWLSADGMEPAPVPTWIAPLLVKPEREKRTAPPGVVMDHPRAIGWGDDYLRRHEPVVEGFGSDAAMIPIFNRLGDWGITEATAVDLVEKHLLTEQADGSPFDNSWLREKVGSAYQSRQNELGCDCPAKASEIWPHVAANPSTPPASAGEPDRARSKYAGHKPSELADKPRPTFWDADKTMPRAPEGNRILAVGKYSSHKTNLVLAKVLDAIRDHGARVVYCAGEAFEGVGRDRIPAQCAVRGIKAADLDDKLAVVAVCPRLTDPEEVDAFIEAHKAFRPDIVIIDTMSEALTGQDENGSDSASVVMAEAGRIRRAFNATVILVHHLGKDGSKGARGSSVFASGADAVWEMTFDTDTGLVHQKIEKQRDGQAKHTIDWGTRIVMGTGADGVMTVVPISQQEARQLAAKVASKATAEHPTRGLVARTLAECGAHTLDASVSLTALAAAIGNSQVAGPLDPRRQDLIARARKAVDNGSRDRRGTGHVLLKGLFTWSAWPRDGASTTEERRFWCEAPADDADDDCDPAESAEASR